MWLKMTVFASCDDEEGQKRKSEQIHKMERQGEEPFHINRNAGVVWWTPPEGAGGRDIYGAHMQYFGAITEV